MTEERFLSAQDAAAELEISLATLYAYASRGQVHSEPVPGDAVWRWDFEIYDGELPEASDDRRTEEA